MVSESEHSDVPDEPMAPSTQVQTVGIFEAVSESEDSDVPDEPMAPSTQVQMVRISEAVSESEDSDVPDWSKPPFTQVPIKRKTCDDSTVSGTDDEDEEILEAEWSVEIIDDAIEPTEDSIMDCDDNALHANPVPVVARLEKVAHQCSVVKQAKMMRTTSLVSHQI